MRGWDRSKRCASTNGTRLTEHSAFIADQPAHALRASIVAMQLLTYANYLDLEKLFTLQKAGSSRPAIFSAQSIRSSALGNVEDALPKLNCLCVAGSRRG